MFRESTWIQRIGFNVFLSLARFSVGLQETMAGNCGMRDGPCAARRAVRLIVGRMRIDGPSLQHFWLSVPDHPFA